MTSGLTIPGTLGNPTPFLVGALLLFFGVRWFIVPADRHRIEKLMVLCVPIAPLFIWCVRYALDCLTALSLPVYDFYAYRVDTLISGNAGFYIAQFAASHPLANLLIDFSYNLFTFATICVIGLYLWKMPRKTLRVCAAFTLNLILVVGLYLIVPICGPRYAFPSFPQLPANVPLRTLAILAPPNGMPSAHVSSALLVAWFLRRWSWGRVTGAVFVALTVIAVLGTGEHYLVDAIGAVPYTAGVLWLSGTKETKNQIQQKGLK